MRIVRFFLFAVAVLIALLGIAIGGIYMWADARSKQPVALPAPRGPYLVGRTIVDVSDPRRHDQFNGLQSRRLSVWIWYPAAAASPRSAQYYPDSWLTVIHNWKAGFVETRPEMIRTHSFEGALISRANIRFPVLIFEPGLGLYPANYTTLLEDLASRGYVVAAINPTDTVDVVFTDGSVAQSADQMRDLADPPEIVRIWADDIKFVLKQLPIIEQSTPFSGRLALGHVGMFGHSIGGAAALEACAQIITCSSAVDIDGTPYSYTARSGLRRPFLFIGHEGSVHEGPDDARELMVLLGKSPSAKLIEIKGTRHFSFSDRTVLFELLGPLFLGPLDGARCLRIVADDVDSYFRRTIGLATRSHRGYYPWPDVLKINEIASPPIWSLS